MRRAAGLLSHGLLINRVYHEEGVQPIFQTRTAENPNATKEDLGETTQRLDEPLVTPIAGRRPTSKV